MYYFGFAYCNKWSGKTFCTLLNQSKSKANPVTTWLPTFFSSFTCKWFAFFNFKSSNCLCKVLLSNLIGQRSYVTFTVTQFWGWLLSWKDVFFHLVNVKVHFRGRLELSLKSICSFRPHKIPLFMLWRGSDKGYQDKLRIVFHQMLRTAPHHTNPEKILFRGLPWSRAVGSWTDSHPTQGTQTIT